MKWTTLCEVTSKKLNRELKKEESDFLRWVYDKYRSEEGMPSDEETTKI